MNYVHNREFPIDTFRMPGHESADQTPRCTGADMNDKAAFAL